MMRVLAVDSTAQLGGAQQMLLRLAPLLRPHDVQLDLICTPGSALAREWGARGATFPVLSDAHRSIRRSGGGVSARAGASTATDALRQARTLARLFSAEHPDLVVSNAHWMHADVVAAARLARVPAVLYVHDMALPGLGTALRRLLVLASRRTVAVSEPVAAQLRGRLTRNRVTVIGNGVDATVFHPGAPDPRVRAELAQDPAAPLAVMLARPDPIKRVEHALEVVRRVPELQLAVLGEWEGAYAAALRRAAAPLGGRVRFVGARRDVADCLRSADVLLHASASEGMALAALEALACGLPVVGYAIAGMKAVVPPTAGVLVPELAGEDGLAAAVRGLVDDPERRRRLGAAGADYVAREHSAAERAQQLATVFREAAR